MNQPTMPQPSDTAPRTPADWTDRYAAGHVPPPAPSRPSLRPGLWQVPTLFWAALGVAAGTFLVKATSYEYGGTYCSYTDYAAYLGAAVVALLGVGGWVQRARARADERLAVPYALAFTVAIAAMTTLHVLRGAGDIGGLCA